MIYTCNLILTGELTNIPALYANTIMSPGFSNIQFESSINVNGSIYGTGHMDMGSTMYATFRLSSNLNFVTNEIHGNAAFGFDYTAADMTDMSQLQMVIPPYQVFNYNTGIVTVPVSGLYNLNIQGSFENDVNATNPINGVYYKLLNWGHSNARIAANIGYGPVKYTTYTNYFLAGDRILPIFYSSDQNATLLGNGETFVAFSVLSTTTPTHSNYYRV